MWEGGWTVIQSLLFRFSFEPLSSLFLLSSDLGVMLCSRFLSLFVCCAYLCTCVLCSVMTSNIVLYSILFLYSYFRFLISRSLSLSLSFSFLSFSFSFLKNAVFCDWNVIMNKYSLFYFFKFLNPNLPPLHPLNLSNWMRRHDECFSIEPVSLNRQFWVTDWQHIDWMDRC